MVQAVDRSVTRSRVSSLDLDRHGVPVSVGLDGSELPVSIRAWAEPRACGINTWSMVYSRLFGERGRDNANHT